MLRLVGPLIVCSLAVPKARNSQHPRQVLPVSFAIRWSRRRPRMGYPSIFLSVSFGRKVALMRLQSAQRALRALRNSCQEPPIGGGSVIHSM